MTSELTGHGRVLFAQTVRGVVTAVNTGEPVHGAEASFVDLNGKRHPPVLTDESGAFGLTAPAGGGEYILWVRMIGYRPQPIRVALQTSDTLTISVNLEPHVPILEGVTVYGETADGPGQREFLSRRSLKWNFSLNRKEIQQLHVGNIDWLLKMVPVRTRCNPVIYLDGHKSPIDGRKTPLDWVYGIEIYRGYFDVPLKYRDGTDYRRTRCGVILIWTTTVGKEK